MRLARTNNNNPDFKKLVKELDADLRERYGAQQDTYDQYNLLDYLDTAVIAYEKDIPVGCGCFKKFDTDSVEIKRMYVAKEYRGKGVGALILTELETWAAELGYHSTVLETAGKQLEAIALYNKLGYSLIPKYGPYVDLPASICMKKSLSL